MRLGKGKDFFTVLGRNQGEKAPVSLPLACSTDTTCIEVKTGRKCTRLDLAVRQIIRTVGTLQKGGTRKGGGFPFPAGDSREKSLFVAF